MRHNTYGKVFGKVGRDDSSWVVRRQVCYTLCMAETLVEREGSREQRRVTEADHVKQSKRARARVQFELRAGKTMLSKQGNFLHPVTGARPREVACERKLGEIWTAWFNTVSS